MAVVFEDQMKGKQSLSRCLRPNISQLLVQFSYLETLCLWIFYGFSNTRNKYLLSLTGRYLMQ